MNIVIEYTITGETMPVWPELDDTIRAFMRRHGFKDVGSGSGMGARDMEFEKEEND